MNREREAFENWMTNDGKFPRAVEKDANGQYVLMQTASAWNVWVAACEWHSSILPKKEAPFWVRVANERETRMEQENRDAMEKAKRRNIAPSPVWQSSGY